MSSSINTITTHYTHNYIFINTRVSADVSVCVCVCVPVLVCSVFVYGRMLVVEILTGVFITGAEK